MGFTVISEDLDEGGKIIKSVFPFKIKGKLPKEIITQRICVGYGFTV